LRKDGRSQRCALANNLAANAMSLVKAVHQGGTMLELGASRQDPHLARTGPAKRRKMHG
jgi:hypothetical protein